MINHFSNTASTKQLTAAVGSLISVLDECLINGGDPMPISNISVTNNVATVTLNPSTDSYDPYWRYIEAMYHFEGSNNSVYFQDSSRNAYVVTVNGAAVISTSQYRFGSSSGWFPNSSNANIYYGTYTSAASTDFTVEMWVKVNGKTGGGLFTNNGQMALTINTSGQAVYSISAGAGYAVTITGTTDLSTGGTNGWHHLAFVRRGPWHALFVDGTSEGTPATTAGINSISNAAMYLGGYSGQNGCNCWIDDFRYTIGVCRYTSNFTAPTVVFTDSRFPIFNAQQSLTIAGGTGDNTVFNGTFKLTNATTDGFYITFPITTNVNPGSVSNMTAQVASLGWTKSFSGTNKAVYRSSDNSGTQLYLMVDDTNATYSMVSIYEQMLSIDSGINPSSNLVQQYWTKSIATTNATRNWWLAGDDKTFYFIIDFMNNGNPIVNVFGDFISLKPSDAYRCLLIGTTTQFPTGAFDGNKFFYSRDKTNYTGHIVARSFSQVAGAQYFYKWTSSPNTRMGYDAGIPYPNPADNALHFSPVYVYEQQNDFYRGMMRGIYVPFESTGGIFTNKDVSVVVGGHTYIAYNISYSSGTVPYCNFWIDMTGPWAS